ncbi:hypothetical protein THRCLA_10674, partial [Thraustotheca clavata]
IRSYYDALPVQSMTWVWIKLAWRVLLSFVIVFKVVRSYFLPLYHLFENLDLYPLSDRSKNATHYEILVGEPTSIIISDPLVCLAFSIDILASADYSMQAMVRVQQWSSPKDFFLGAIYLSRHVWISYMALILLHPVLQKFKMIHWCFPQTTTGLAIIITTVSSVLANVILMWYPFIGIFNSLYCSMTKSTIALGYYTIEAFPVLLCYLGVLWIIPLFLSRRLPDPEPDPPELAMMKSYISATSTGRGRNVPLDIMSRSQIVKQPSATPIPALAPNEHTTHAKFSYNDYKQIFFLWLCRNEKPVDADFCSGASLYRLFDMDPSHQTLSTINYRGTDCYIYTYIANHQLADVTRVSLLSQLAVKGARRRKVAVATRSIRDGVRANIQRFAVGRIVIRDPTEIDDHGSAALIHGARNSPWIE